MNEIKHEDNANEPEKEARKVDYYIEQLKIFKKNLSTRLHKFIRSFKDVFLTICFLFRPATTIVVSCILMVAALSLLIAAIVNIPENTKIYEILLAVLTGISASFVVSITIELCNNYHFNCKRQRELRKYLGFISNYRISQNSFLKTFNEYESENKLGSGKIYVVFYQLKDIIPQLRESLNYRDYLYLKEINNIDDIIYNYDMLLEIIGMDLFSTFLGLICSISEELDFNDDKELKDYYPKLFNFLETEASYYVDTNKYNLDFHEGSSEYLKTVIEKAIFYNLDIFTGYFEVSDKHYKEAKSDDLEDIEGPTLKKNLNHKQVTFKFLSNMISLHCGNIDKSIISLEKRVRKEPYFRVKIEYADEIFKKRL